MAVRSETSRSAILDATIELLKRDGATVQRLTIEAIAKEAGVGKATIYRWWPSKVAVVIDAFVENYLPETPVPKDLPLHDALEQHLRSLIAQYSGFSGRLVAQLVAESQYDPETRAAFRDRFFDERYRTITDLVTRGIERGELPVGTDPGLFSEMLYSPIYRRLLLGHRPLNEDLAHDLVTQAFLSHDISRSAPSL